MILSYYFIRKKLVQLLAQPIHREHQFCSLDDVKSVLLVYLEKDKQEVELCVSQLNLMKKNVKRLIFVEDAMLNETENPDTVYCVLKELNVWAFPSEKLIKEVASLSADLLIDLVVDNCFPLQYLELQHAAKLKVGPKRENGDFYDFSLSLTQHKEIGYMFEQILFYLQTFRMK